MMNQQQAIDFGKASASMAYDQRGEYATLADAVDSYRDNVRDTLNDERSAEHEEAAWAAFDAEIVRFVNITA